MMPESWKDKRHQKISHIQSKFMKKNLPEARHAFRTKGIFMTALVIVAFSVLSLQASDSSSKITIVRHNATVFDVLMEIERQTGLKFFYNNSQVDAERRVTVEFTKANLKQVLRALLNTPRL